MTRLSRIIQTVIPAEPEPSIKANLDEGLASSASVSTEAVPVATALKKGPKHNCTTKPEKTSAEATRSKATDKRSTTAQSKSATVLAMLRKRNGATLQQLMDATGWQAHSVRGFLSGHIHKKLGLSIAGEDRQGRHSKVSGHRLTEPVHEERYGLAIRDC